VGGSSSPGVGGVLLSVGGVLIYFSVAVRLGYFFFYGSGGSGIVILLWRWGFIGGWGFLVGVP